MTPAEVSAALMGAVRGAGGDVPEVGLRCLGAGVYGSPVALRARVDAGNVARVLRGTPGIASVGVREGFLTVEVERPGDLATEILAQGDAYGVAEVPRFSWPDRPRTFENPGFRVRFAYMRAVAVRRWAGELGVSPGEPVVGAGEELRLLALLGEMPGRATRMPRYLVRLADGFHDFFERCPALPRGQEKPGAVHAARVTLAGAARIALGNGLKMIGETPRERI